MHECEWKVQVQGAGVQSVGAGGFVSHEVKTTAPSCLSSVLKENPPSLVSRCRHIVDLIMFVPTGAFALPWLCGTTTIIIARCLDRERTA